MKYIILILATQIFASTSLTLINHNQNSDIDSLVAHLYPYLSDPMSWCSETPSSAEIDGNRIVITTEIHCDRTVVQQSIMNIISPAMGKFTPKAGWDGILGTNEGMSRFLVAIHTKYPWIRAIWNQSECNMVFRTDPAYGDRDRVDPLFLSVYVDGILLTDMGVSGSNDEYEDMNGTKFDPHSNHFSGGHTTRTESIVRIDVGQPVAELVFEPADDDNYLPTVSDFSKTVTFSVNPSILNKIKDNGKVDVNIVHVAHEYLPGNREYRFANVR